MGWSFDFLAEEVGQQSLLPRKLVVVARCESRRIRRWVVALLSRVHLVPEADLATTYDLDLVVEVDVNGAVVGTDDVGKNVRVADPGEEAGSDEDVVETSAVVGGPARSEVSATVARERSRSYLASILVFQPGEQKEVSSVPRKADEARLTGVHERPRRVQTPSNVDHGTIGADELVEPLARRVIREVGKTLVLRALVGLGAVDGRVADVLPAKRVRRHRTEA